MTYHLLRGAFWIGRKAYHLLLWQRHWRHAGKSETWSNEGRRREKYGVVRKVLGRVWAGCPRRGSPFSPPSGVCRLINLTNDPLNSNNLTNLPHTDTEASTADKIKKKSYWKTERKKDRESDLSGRTVHVQRIMDKFNYSGNNKKRQKKPCFFNSELTYCM